jgi:hypothetical protein
LATLLNRRCDICREPGVIMVAQCVKSTIMVAN